MVQAEKAAGDHEQAAKDLNGKVFNRRDDDLPPVDLPERTKQIVRGKNWGSDRTRPRQTG